MAASWLSSAVLIASFFAWPVKACASRRRLIRLFGRGQVDGLLPAGGRVGHAAGHVGLPWLRQVFWKPASAALKVCWSAAVDVASSTSACRRRPRRPRRRPNPSGPPRPSPRPSRRCTTPGPGHWPGRRPRSSIPPARRRACPRSRPISPGRGLGAAHRRRVAAAGAPLGCRGCRGRDLIALLRRRNRHGPGNLDHARPGTASSVPVPKPSWHSIFTVFVRNSKSLWACARRLAWAASAVAWLLAWPFSAAATADA